MRGFLGFLGVFIAVFALTATPVSAAQLSKSGIITISGTVPPAKYAYVDDQNNVTKVISNCTSDAPVGFIRSSTNSRLDSPSIAVQSQYELIKSLHNFNTIGTVYDSSTDSKPITQPDPKPQTAKLLIDRLPLGSLKLSLISPL